MAPLCLSLTFLAPCLVKRNIRFNSLRDHCRFENRQRFKVIDRGTSNARKTFRTSVGGRANERI